MNIQLIKVDKQYQKQLEDMLQEWREDIEKKSYQSFS